MAQIRTWMWIPPLQTTLAGAHAAPPHPLPPTLVCFRAPPRRHRQDKPLTFEQFQRWAQSTPAVQALLQGAFPSDAHFSLATSPA